eukprot:scaffold297443_cov55-Prasinocladus_malaysianus.AAC.1
MWRDAILKGALLALLASITAEGYQLSHEDVLEVAERAERRILIQDTGNNTCEVSPEQVQAIIDGLTEKIVGTVEAVTVACLDTSITCGKHKT